MNWNYSSKSYYLGAFSAMFIWAAMDAYSSCSSIIPSILFFLAGLTLATKYAMLNHEEETLFKIMEFVK